MQGKQYWYGREVEGRLTGVLTCFVRVMLPEANEIPKGVVHFYFTYEFMRVEKCWKTVESLLDKGILVTCEVDDDILESLACNIRVRAHLIYRIKTPSLALLKNTDSVALDVAPYDVKITTLHHFQEVKPQDYTHDFERT